MKSIDCLKPFLPKETLLDIIMLSISTSSKQSSFLYWWNLHFSISISPNVIISLYFIIIQFFHPNQYFLINLWPHLFQFQNSNIVKVYIYIYISLVHHDTCYRQMVETSIIYLKIPTVANDTLFRCLDVLSY